MIMNVQILVFPGQSVNSESIFCVNCHLQMESRVEKRKRKACGILSSTRRCSHTNSKQALKKLWCDFCHCFFFNPLKLTKLNLFLRMLRQDVKYKKRNGHKNSELMFHLSPIRACGTCSGQMAQNGPQLLHQTFKRVLLFRSWGWSARKVQLVWLLGFSTGQSGGSSPSLAAKSWVE